MPRCDSRIVKPSEWLSRSSSSADLVGDVIVDVADEAQRDVVVFRIDPAGPAEAAAFEREGELHVAGNFEAGKEPGQLTRLLSRRFATGP